jgi:hypothetical protein
MTRLFMAQAAATADHATAQEHSPSKQPCVEAFPLFIYFLSRAISYKADKISCLYFRNLQRYDTIRPISCYVLCHAKRELITLRKSLEASARLGRIGGRRSSSQCTRDGM